ncbi:MAG: hypothetical protein AAF978_05915, partial [Cyanobacteria bacterium P01_E01_bin.48]
TLDMLFDDDLSDGEEIRWRTESGSFTYIHNSQMAETTRSLVKRYVRLPDLTLTFGFRPANLLLVELL